MENVKTRVRLDVSYDGTSYFGWQRQTCTPLTIQGKIEFNLSKLFNEPIGIMGAGRTDAGVHAEGQVAHFDAPSVKLNKIRLLRALNAVLPKDIAILRVRLAPGDFHAVASSESKTYLYRIWNSNTPNALNSRYSTWIKKPLSIENLNKISKVLLGTHDFKSFQSSGSTPRSTIRTIERVKWERSGNHVVFEIAGTGFLKQMVRNIVGTALDLFFEGYGPNEMAEILEKKDRTSAGPTASAEGLILKCVEYPQNLDRQCRDL